MKNNIITITTLASVAIMTNVAKGQQVVDEFAWMPATTTQTAIPSGGLVAPSGDYVITGSNSFYNNQGTSDNLLVDDLNNGSFTLTFSQPLLSLDLGAWAIGANEQYQLSIAPDGIRAYDGLGYAQTDLALAGGTTVHNPNGWTTWEKASGEVYYNSLPAGTTSITLNAVYTGPGDGPDGAGSNEDIRLSYIKYELDDSVVPEPSSALLTAIAAFGLLCRRKRRA